MLKKYVDWVESWIHDIPEFVLLFLSIPIMFGFAVCFILFLLGFDD